MASKGLSHRERKDKGPIPKIKSATSLPVNQLILIVERLNLRKKIAKKWFCLYIILNLVKLTVC